MQGVNGVHTAGLSMNHISQGPPADCDVTGAWGLQALPTDIVWTRQSLIIHALDRQQVQPMAPLTHQHRLSGSFYELSSNSLTNLLQSHPSPHTEKPHLQPATAPVPNNMSYPYSQRSTSAPHSFLHNCLFVPPLLRYLLLHFFAHLLWTLAKSHVCTHLSRKVLQPRKRLARESSDGVRG